MKLKSNLLAALAITVCGLIAQPSVHAKQGATDPIPGTSKGTVKSGGGKSTTPTPAPAPNPIPAISSGPITFIPSSPGIGDCSGDFNILPYYPTLLDMTVNVSVSNMSVPDGTVLYVNLVGTSNGTVYPYSGNAIVINGGSGVCSEKAFITLGAALTGVVITDANGNPVFAGN